MAMEESGNHRQFYLAALCAAALLAYSLPWVMNPGIGLTFGAYDLAEWASLHPAVRNSALPFLTSLLLRLPFACLSLIIASHVLAGKTRLRLLFLLLASIALLTPFEFFTQYRDDPNYRQQFILALATCLIGLALSGNYLRRFARSAGVLIAVIGTVASFWGLIQGYSLMRSFDLPTRIGFGGFAFIAVYGAMVYLFGMKVVMSLKQTR
jgi:hypothetical protein